MVDGYRDIREPPTRDVEKHDELHVTMADSSVFARRIDAAQRWVSARRSFNPRTVPLIVAECRILLLRRAA